MRVFIYSINILALLFCTLLVSLGCNDAGAPEVANDSLSIRKSIPPSPVLSPQESIKKMHLEDGLIIQLVAAEPLISSPVAMSFDDSGRIWVVEMQGYMPDTLGNGEDQPSGKIVILSDSNGDGVMDRRKIFLSSLVLPRAISFVEDGILVAEPPKLWYYKIENDLPVHKTLVDSQYAEGGNVEHQPNGLLRAMDNWIYNAKSDKRYRKSGDKWLIERTHFRGQWGISQDDYGRLLYNNNSENLLGDYFLPGLGATNKNQKAVSGFITKIVEDNRVYPIRPTTGINRGYVEGMLDSTLRLVNFTAACGPVYYNGDLLPKEYYSNTFVAEPSANLIKRNIIIDEGYKISGKQAYKNKEFLASEDERFRPVSLYNAPDGALYIVDMYRGIIQHKTYLTPYLKNEIKERALSNPLNCGRIYKIVPAKKNVSLATIPSQAESLVSLLQSSNGWIRNRAQQKIIDKKLTQTIPAIRNVLHTSSNQVARIHALWTLEGLSDLKWDDVAPFLQTTDIKWRMQAFAIIPSIINKSNSTPISQTLLKLANEADSLSAPYIGFLLPYIKKYDAATVNKIMQALLKNYNNNRYVADAIISNIEGKEATFSKAITNSYPDTTLAIHKRLKKVIDDIAKAKNSQKTKELQKQYARGTAIFQSVCATCHGADGNGVASLAPPLNNSEWVTGDKNNFIPIVLFGLTGPIKVGGKIYQAPEINGDMPGIGQNDEFSDEDIAQLLTLIRNSWNNNGSKITKADIQAARQKHKGREKPFTMKELSQSK